jgi:bifunctional UDP-N-acetylglucosamine pyrophosphorylase/glucosamine-1-phosphate N-acetyltransferase
MRHVAVVLAAGQGTRMRSDLPKVAHRVAGRPMIQWVVDAVLGTEPVRTVVVVGHGADEVRSLLPDGVEECVQERQLGTGHAVRVALDWLGDPEVRPVLIIPGDTPLITAGTLRRLTTAFEESGSALAMLSTRLDDPTGYGRIVRSADGEVVGIVEERDADPEIRAIDEINAGMYLFRGDRLRSDLSELRADNAQGEQYLTDVVGLMAARGERIVAVEASPDEVAGVNTVAQLEEANRRHPGLR